ncbi:hypothetical protein BOTBODRAFT_28681 [Botryobasidium botryosum FD-172 SS1]|uniref:Protein HGH1 homolog n=1 Tax=Botryobasidium botryosum (strain FD-172 SS1) TaxID=930990 RepID=A0A067MTX8_BOTB1|nr:hypothetical protein BOTBODRAFT_28681 [Botryobasidium botryosum FD-172 SS1]
MDTQLRELLAFLHDRNPQVRQLALSNVLGYTPKGSEHRDIFLDGLSAGGLKPGSGETQVIRDLKLLCRDQPAIAHDAFKALVNLSDSPLLAASLSERSFLVFLVSYTVHPASVLADLAAMILSNLSAHPNVPKAILSLVIPILASPSSLPPYYAPASRCPTSPPPEPYPDTDVTYSVSALSLLVDAFSRVEPDGTKLDQRKRKGELHFLSSVFANISGSPPGRSFFLTPMPVDPLPPQTEGQQVQFEYPLAKIISFTEHPNLMRRGGVASTIKNCAFHVPAHRAILSASEEKIIIPPATVAAPAINALVSILLPLAGPEEFDLEDTDLLPPALQFLPPTKTREIDPVLRLTHVETLLLLCSTRWGRDHLRANGVYPIIRVMHESEGDDAVVEHVERLVNFLKRDEANEANEDEEEVLAAAVPQDVHAKSDEEDDDDKIVEI